jgi:molecular chaperone GrpE
MKDDKFKMKNNANKKNDNLEKKLKLKIKNLKKDLKKKDDKLLRSYADYQNFKKRIEKEFEKNKKDIKKKYLSYLIDLRDLLKNAYEDKNSKKGLKIIIDNLDKILNEEQIKYINCIGKKFDHNIHHAITTIGKKDCEDEIIIEEVKKGYLIDGNLLRPSHVIVNKKEEIKKR